MAIRIPLRAVASFNDDGEIGAGSVAGGVQHPFQLLQDTNNVVVRFSASVAGTGVSAVLQTTPDGGTTYYDVGRTSIISNGVAGYSEEWLSVPVFGAPARTTVLQASVVATGSVQTIGSVGMTIGNSGAASTLAQSAYSGMPILSQQARIFIRINGNVTSAAANQIRTTVFVNEQSSIS